MKNKPSYVIGICGPKQAGKTTVANFLRELLGSELVQEISFAGPLKRICGEVFNLSQTCFEDQSLKEKELTNYKVLDSETIDKITTKFNLPLLNKVQKLSHATKILKTPREILQYVGTDLLRTVDDSIHVKTAMAERDLSKITISADVRFSNEFEYLNALTDTVFCPLYVFNLKAESFVTKDSHESEKQYRDFVKFCTKIDNNEDLESLKLKVSEYVNQTIR